MRASFRSLVLAAAVLAALPGVAAGQRGASIRDFGDVRIDGPVSHRNLAVYVLYAFGWLRPEAWGLLPEAWTGPAAPAWAPWIGRLAMAGLVGLAALVPLGLVRRKARDAAE